MEPDIGKMVELLSEGLSRRHAVEVNFALFLHRPYILKDHR